MTALEHVAAFEVRYAYAIVRGMYQGLEAAASQTRFG